MPLDFRHTRIACYTGSFLIAIVNLFPALLFVQFRQEFGVSLAQLTYIVTVNFVTQIVIDLLATPIVLKIGYRAAMIVGQLAAVLGLVSLAILPSLLGALPYLGILVATLLSAVGGGLMETLVSPVIQSLPSRNKVAEMNFLHSAYCWGAMIVILLSTGLFHLFGIQHWRYVTAAWALIPALNALLLTAAPLVTPEDGDAPSMKLGELLRSPIFAALIVLMLCSGASELAMSQWASYFAEKGLQLNKAMGDILGPCAFAALMGISRVIFALSSPKLNLRHTLAGTSILCVAAYLLTVFAPTPILSLIGCAICGLSVGFMWPGTFSLAGQILPRGGTLMFALFAFAGDIGCTLGPSTVGLLSNHFEHNPLPLFASQPETAALKFGLLCVILFPILLTLTIPFLSKYTKHP